VLPSYGHLLFLGKKFPPVGLGLGHPFKADIQSLLELSGKVLNLLSLVAEVLDIILFLFVE
jgi:hypothetical protein